MTKPILELTDGTTTVSLIRSEGQTGIHLNEWVPAVADYKGGGIWRDGSLTDGRRLVDTKWANVTESYDLKINGLSQDEAIRTMQDARRLLEKAASYWTTNWQDDPVYLIARGPCESETRYSLVCRGRIPEDDNPYAAPFFGDNAVLDDVTLLLECVPWKTGYPPGDAVCVEASGEQEDWKYKPWVINTAQPGGNVFDIFELSSGWMLAADTAQVWRTNTGAAVWTAATTPPAGGVTDFAELSSWAYCLTTTGVYRSNDNGNNWTLRNANVKWVVIPPRPNTGLLGASDGYLYAACTNVATIGVHRSNDGGITWTTVYTDAANTEMGEVFETSEGTLLVATEWIIRSTNGTTWQSIESVTGPGSFWEITTGANVGIYYLSSNSKDVWKSIDDGTSWFKISDFVSNVREPTDILAKTNTGEFLASDISSSTRPFISGTSDGTRWRSFSPVDPPGLFVYSLVQFSGNNRIYAGVVGNIWISPISTAITTVGRDVTCSDEVFIANKQNVAQITHVKVDDGGVFTDRFPATFPFNLLPDPFAMNDAVYFGIETAVAQSGPFNNLVFDIGDVLSAVATLVWEYWDGGAWSTLNVQDRTSVLEVPGVNSVHWVPPNDWDSTVIDGVGAYWVRLRVSALTTHAQTPTQQNRDVYTTNWPRIDVGDSQVLGDIPALLKIRAHNRSDKDYYNTKDELDSLSNRVLIGLRSLSRGSSFTAFLNCSDEQNPIGVSVTSHVSGALDDFIVKESAPTGRIVPFSTTAVSSPSLDNYYNAVTISLDRTICPDFYGTYHAFLRAQLEESFISPSGGDDDVRVRLKIQSGSGGISKVTQFKRFVGWDKNGETFKDWQLLDFGRVDLPSSDLFRITEIPDQLNIVVQIANANGTDLVVNLYDVVLIPIDEWAGDFIDSALENDSGVGNGRLLDIDSVTYPKRRIRSLVRTADASEFITASYQPITPGPAILQSNADQRLWFLTARAVYLGEDTAGAGATLTDDHADFLRAGVEPGMTAYNITDSTSATITSVTKTTCVCNSAIWAAGEDYMIICNGIYRSEPWNCHSIQLFCNPRYLSLRGDR